MLHIFPLFQAVSQALWSHTSFTIASRPASAARYAEISLRALSFGALRQPQGERDGLELVDAGTVLPGG